MNSHDLVELIRLEPSLKLDIRYATPDNFVGRAVYPEARAFLQRPAAEALIQVHRDLAADGLGLLIFDAYRPWHVTQIFWDVTPEPLRIFVANPEKGSVHNRGCAIDLSLFELATGKEVRMPSVFDEMTERSYTDYTGGLEAERQARERLLQAMIARGFSNYRYEWWHYNFQGWNRYPILDLAFDEIEDRL